MAASDHLSEGQEHRQCCLGEVDCLAVALSLVFWQQAYQKAICMTALPCSDARAALDVAREMKVGHRDASHAR